MQLENFNIKNDSMKFPVQKTQTKKFSGKSFSLKSRALNGSQTFFFYNLSNLKFLNKKLNKENNNSFVSLLYMSQVYSLPYNISTFVYLSSSNY